MDWRNEYQHRDWERMVEAVFDACVRGPIEADSGRWNDELPLARYDIDHPSYLAHSWIQVGADHHQAPIVLVRLASDREPFDTVRAVVLDRDKLAPIEQLNLPFESNFFFVRRSGRGSDQIVHEIEAVE
jgi:hypothetical protein